ncbi:Uncharacterised protein [Vibrio cincinnatiensis]|uniref:Uncharacterized protein n=1 Tax=Vibrio cincinnatiensis DSM 19608 TaxID=1123491 RepID=A0A1T4SIW5_VIBCI|nr:hypothetical protein SAMN02745782_03323 [Vibrio cincinnatiensis DSM 19608]SUP05787.1 Uncharacterised protein [Vibrio cincinnatiensis]
MRGTFVLGEHLRLRLVSLSSVVSVACPLMRRYALIGKVTGVNNESA